MSTKKPAARAASASPTDGTSTQKPECFVIMPITDPDDYPKGHFGRVFDDIFLPACEKAGFIPVHPGRVRQTNLIHLDVLQRLLNAPMALCDLSTRNPNVLFELGLRQAFDMPVALVREIGTQDIFDIAPLRYTEYRKERIYNEVLEDQEKIAEALRATQEAFQNGEGINSIVKLLSLTKPASLKEYQEAEKDPVLQIIRAELSELRAEFRQALQAAVYAPTEHRLVTPPPSEPSEDDILSHRLQNLNLLLKDVETTIEAAKTSIDEKKKAERLLTILRSRITNTDALMGPFTSAPLIVRFGKMKARAAGLEKRFTELPLIDDEIPF